MKFKKQVFGFMDMLRLKNWFPTEGKRSHQDRIRLCRKCIARTSRQRGSTRDIWRWS